MAIIDCTPDSFFNAVSSAAQMDILRMGPGTYPTFHRKSGITYRAVDWSPDRALEGAGGHLGQNCAVRITQANATWATSGMTLEGVFFDTRGSSAINSAIIAADDITMDDCVVACRPASGVRQIGLTLGTGSTRVQGFRFRRGRHHPTGQPGQKLDHAFYLKNCEGCEVTDSILYDGGRFPLHLYTNADHNLFDRVVIWGSAGCITFSGAADSSTGTPTYGTSDFNTLRNSILGQAQIDMVGAWTSDPSKPVAGNQVTHTMFWKGTGAAPYPSSLPGVVIGADCVRQDPGFKDPARGDFTRQGAWDGFGPAQLCGYVPPPPPDPEPTRDELLVGDLTAIRNRLTGVEAWRNLTAAQRESIIAARRRAEIALGRLAP